MKVLFVDVSRREARVEDIVDERIKGILDLGIYLHLERYKSYEVDVFDERNIVVAGTGPLNFPGTNRGVFVFRSPIHGGIHSSTMGGFGEYIKRAGYDAIVFEGKSNKPVFVSISNDKIEFIDEEVPECIFKKEKELYEKFKEKYSGKFRICLVGKASLNTVYGCIVSSNPEKLESIPDVAGRGGAGSVLLRAHNVVGFLVGGTSEIELNQNPELIKKQIESTKKYRESGTFGANYPHLKENTIMFNWKIFYLDKKNRLEFYNKFIENELLKNYTFTSSTCGEKCVATCKKIENNVKIDYEPAEGLGPFIGIFDRKFILDLIKTVDSYGFDAIYLGQVLGLIFEALEQGKIKLKELGLDKTPIISPEKYDEDYSELNYKIAKELITKIANGELKILGKNIRKITKEFNIKDLALYVPIGEEYDMTPNYYWSLGLILPIAMHGKYFSDYKTVFKPPKEYAEICAKRTINEYILDNLGVCRFHRAWVETDIISEELIRLSKLWIRKLFEYREKANANIEFWESKRIKDVVARFIEEYGNDDWREKVKQDYEQALNKYWDEWMKIYYQLTTT